MYLILAKLNAYRRLGWQNLFRVFWYRLRLKLNWFEKSLPAAPPVSGAFFPEPEHSGESEAPSPVTIQQHFLLFGWKSISLESCPDWHCSVLTGKRYTQTTHHWSALSDFDTGVGDIKGIWELSRFTWLLSLIQNYQLSRDPKWVTQANTWLHDWTTNNPANCGPNWKCAQEVSFRVMHLAAAAYVLNHRTPSATTREFLRQHLSRIWPTTSYARGQDNNHGTSEAAALLIGGTWLLALDPKDKVARRWARQGRAMLEERLNTLVLSDGSFSQYSVTYHRLMLDTVSFSEMWLIFQRQPSLSDRTYRQAKQATMWLYNMVDEISGDAPNLGANDGAHILNFLQMPFRDFRPSVEIASQLFWRRTAYNGTLGADVSCFLNPVAGLQTLEALPHKTSALFERGGYATLSTTRAFAMLRIPRFQFRPSQADCLHLDFWLRGENILRDGGSYSYNTDNKWLDYFSGVASHNTVQFDDHQPMIKVSRFLFAAWPTPKNVRFVSNKQCASASAGYTDYKHCRHHRNVALGEDMLEIEDTLDGFTNKAVIRWRLPPGDWRMTNAGVTSEERGIVITWAAKDIRAILETGVESLYYGHKKPITVLKMDVAQAGKVTTRVCW